MMNLRNHTRKCISKALKLDESNQAIIRELIFLAYKKMAYVQNSNAL